MAALTIDQAISELKAAGATFSIKQGAKNLEPVITIPASARTTRVTQIQMSLAAQPDKVLKALAVTQSAPPPKIKFAALPPPAAAPPPPVEQSALIPQAKSDEVAAKSPYTSSNVANSGAISFKPPKTLESPESPVKQAETTDITPTTKPKRAGKWVMPSERDERVKEATAIKERVKQGNLPDALYTILISRYNILCGMDECGNYEDFDL